MRGGVRHGGVPRASKTWTLPAASTCGEVDAESSILTPGGKARFEIDAQSGTGHPSPGGHVSYVDMGTANKRLASVTIGAVIIVDYSHAEIFGVGKVNGGPAQPFRIDVSHTAAGDTFSIMWARYGAAGPTVKGKVDIDVERCKTHDRNHDGGNDGRGGNRKGGK